jgi:hypothetical protein
VPMPPRAHIGWMLTPSESSRSIELIDCATCRGREGGGRWEAQQRGGGRNEGGCSGREGKGGMAVGWGGSKEGWRWRAEPCLRLLQRR